MKTTDYTVFLNGRTQLLITDALSTVGLNDAFNFMYDRLYVDQVDEIEQFMEWLKETKRPFGRINAQERWQEFIGCLEYQPLPAFYIATTPDVHLTDQRPKANACV